MRSPTQWPARRRAREGNGETTLTPARPAHIPTPALRTSHFPDPPRPSLRPHYRPPLDTEGARSGRASLVRRSDGFLRGHHQRLSLVLAIRDLDRRDIVAEAILELRDCGIDLGVQSP